MPFAADGKPSRRDESSDPVREILVVTNGSVSRFGKVVGFGNSRVIIFVDTWAVPEEVGLILPVRSTELTLGGGLGIGLVHPGVGPQTATRRCQQHAPTPEIFVSTKLTEMFAKNSKVYPFFKAFTVTVVGGESVKGFPAAFEEFSFKSGPIQSLLKTIALPSVFIFVKPIQVLRAASQSSQGWR